MRIHVQARPARMILWERDMNSRGAMFAQAARGPVLLITIGVLFALEQSRVLAFSRSWPLLIIVIGVMKLIERLLLGNTPYQTQQVTSGAVPASVQSYPQRSPAGPPPPGAPLR
jgi:LiaI-LiaF-like transmembrane region